MRSLPVPSVATVQIWIRASGGCRRGRSAPRGDGPLDRHAYRGASTLSANSPSLQLAEYMTRLTGS